MAHICFSTRSWLVSAVLLVRGVPIILLILLTAANCLGQPVAGLRQMTNRHIAVDVNVETGDIARVSDLLSGDVFEILNEVPWRVLVRSALPPFQQRRLLSPAEANCPRPSRIDQSALPDGTNTLRILWLGCAIDPTNHFDSELSLELLPEAGYVRTQFRVDTTGRGALWPGSRSKTVHFGIERLDVYLSPSDMPATDEYGLLSVRWVHGVKEPARVLTSENIPSSYLSSTFTLPEGVSDYYGLSKISAYWRGSGEGLLFFPEQTDGFQPIRTAYRSVTHTDGTYAFQMSLMESMPDDILPGTLAQLALPLRIQPFRAAGLRDGDVWHEATKPYRSYLESETALFRKGRVAQRSDIPQHLKDGDSVIGFWGIERTEFNTPWSDATFQSKVVNMFERTRQALGVTYYTPFFFIGWNDYQRAPHSRYQARSGQEQLFRALGARGNNPFLYVLTGALNVDDPEFNLYRDHLVYDEHGALRVQEDPVYGRFASFDHSSGKWAEYLAPKIAPFVRGSDGAVAVYWDSPFHSQPNYRPGQAHRIGPGSYINAGTAQTIEALEASLRQMNPNFFSISENNPEFASAVHSTLGAEGTFNLPLTIFKPHAVQHTIGAERDFLEVKFGTQLLHPYSPLVTAHVMFGYTDVLNDYEYFQGKSAIEGGGVMMMEEVGKNLNQLESIVTLSQAPCDSGDAACIGLRDYSTNQLKWARRLVTTRRSYKPFLIEGDLLPRAASTIPSMSVRNAGFPGVQFTFPRVSNAAWKAPNGDIGFFFANASNEPVTFEWSLDRARYDMSPGTPCLLLTGDDNGLQGRGERFTGDLRRSTTVEPKAIVVYVVRQVSDVTAPSLMINGDSRGSLLLGRSRAFEVTGDEDINCSTPTETVASRLSARSYRFVFAPETRGPRELVFECTDHEGNRARVSLSVTVRSPRVSMSVKRRTVAARSTQTVSVQVISREIAVQEFQFFLEQRDSRASRSRWSAISSPKAVSAGRFSVALPSGRTQRRYQYRIVLVLRSERLLRRIVTREDR